MQVNWAAHLPMQPQPNTYTHIMMIKLDAFCPLAFRRLLMSRHMHASMLFYQCASEHTREWLPVQIKFIAHDTDDLSLLVFTGYVKDIHCRSQVLNLQHRTPLLHSVQESATFS